MPQAPGSTTFILKHEHLHAKITVILKALFFHNQDNKTFKVINNAKLNL
jgi:hypothetical protein